jgi:LTXXQ motif family protein
MLKTVLAGIVALSLSGVSLAYAQATPPADTPRWRPSAEDAAAMTDARIAALRTGLKLTAEQEKLWPPVEAAIRAFAKQRADRMMARADARRDNSPPSRPDALERMRHNADAMSASGAALKQLADAAEPLYKTLDEGQKRRFSMLLRMDRQGPGGPPPWRRRG